MQIRINDFNQGDIMKIIREWTGLTQKEFAKELNKSKRTIEQYEAGKINYNIEFLLNISKKFNIEIIFFKQ